MDIQITKYKTLWGYISWGIKKIKMRITLIRIGLRCNVTLCCDVITCDSNCFVVWSPPAKWLFSDGSPEGSWWRTIQYEDTLSTMIK